MSVNDARNGWCIVLPSHSSAAEEGGKPSFELDRSATTSKKSDEASAKQQERTRLRNRRHNKRANISTYYDRIVCSQIRKRVQRKFVEVAATVDVAELDIVISQS